MKLKTLPFKACKPIALKLQAVGSMRTVYFWAAQTLCVGCPAKVMIFRTMGRALEKHVKPDCKVLASWRVSMATAQDPRSPPPPAELHCWACFVWKFLHAYHLFRFFQAVLGFSDPMFMCVFIEGTLVTWFKGIPSQGKPPCWRAPYFDPNPRVYIIIAKKP